MKTNAFLYFVVIEIYNIPFTGPSFNLDKLSLEKAQLNLGL